MKDKLKISLEKLFNTLGNQMSDDYYGLQFNFKVDDLEINDDIGHYKITVSTDKTVPGTLFVEDSEWTYGKLSIPRYLAWNLESLTKYIGLKGHIEVELTNVEPPQYFNDDVMVKDYEDDFYVIEDTGTALHIPSGMTYPIYSDGSIDSGNGFHLSEIESEDWWELLTNEDKQNITNFYKP